MRLQVTYICSRPLGRGLVHVVVSRLLTAPEGFLTKEEGEEARTNTGSISSPRDEKATIPEDRYTDPHRAPNDIGSCDSH